MNKKDKELQKELSRSYDILRNGSFKEKIQEAHKQLKYGLDRLYNDLESDKFDEDSYEYYQNKIDLMESFIDYVMKVIKI